MKVEIIRIPSQWSSELYIIVQTSLYKGGDWLHVIWQYGWGWNIFSRKGGVELKSRFLRKG